MGLSDNPVVVGAIVKSLWSINDRLGGGPGLDLQILDTDEVYFEMANVMASRMESSGASDGD